MSESWASRYPREVFGAYCLGGTSRVVQNDDEFLAAVKELIALSPVAEVIVKSLSLSIPAQPKSPYLAGI